MLLRITLWAMLLGSIIIGYFGYQTGSTVTTIVGMLAIIFILFLLFFLAKMTLAAGLTLVKVVVIILLIGGLVLLCIRGCTILLNKGETAVSTTTEAFSNVKEQTFAIPGKLHDTPSWWSKAKSMFGFSQSDQMLEPSTIKPETLVNEPQSSQPQVLTGTVSKILSGTTFIMNGLKLKLYAIDAPDMPQKCLNKRSETYACGRTSKKKLEKLLLKKNISCQLVKPYTDLVYYTICEIQGYDVGATMVSVGWAVADRKVSNVYVPYEQQARQKNEGLWNGKFIAPWEYRQSNLPLSTPSKSGFFKGLLK
ncbi:MAG: thermonuclease family protein [Alphaproteobacteria bacterium]|nr:thermonuclease family protein [Alphaproteobacteria bacterium]